MTQQAEHDEWRELPLMLTVEEVGRLLRIGRSHAYGQTTLYFETAGLQGIPALRLGGVLRVPKDALRELVTTGRLVQLTTPIAPLRASTPNVNSRGRRPRPASQLNLLGSD